MLNVCRDWLTGNFKTKTFYYADYMRNEECLVVNIAPSNYQWIYNERDSEEIIRNSVQEKYRKVVFGICWGSYGLLLKILWI